MTVIGTYALAATVGGAEQFFFQEYLSPTLILASIMLFLLTLTIQPSSARKMHRSFAGNKLVRVITVNSLPLFLFHVMILESLQRAYFGLAINGNTINSIIGVPLNTALTLFISLGIIILLKKIPYLKKLIG